MGRSTWLEVKDPTDWTLSYESGLQEIDAFYDHEQQHEEPPFAAETAGEDEFSTLMEDIEQLTGPGSHNHTDTPSNNKPHSLTSPGDLDDVQLSDAQQSDVATEVTNAQQSSSNGAGHEEIAPPALGSSVNSLSLNLQLNLQQESAALSGAPHFPQDLTSTSLPDQSEPLQSRNLPGLTDTPRSKSEPLPIREPKMTPPKRDDELPPSSDGKSSLMDEMRSEEKRYPGRQDMKEVPREDTHIQLPGIAMEDAENFELHHADAAKPSGANLRKSSASLGTRLRSAAVPQRKTVKSALEDNTQPGAKEGSVVERTVAKNRTMTMVKHQDAEEEVVADVLSEDANAELSVPKGGKKRKENMRDDATHVHEGDVPSNVAKKSKPAAEQPEHHLPIPKLGVEGVANRRPPRNSLGQKEMRRLTESKFLADSTPQRAMSATRQTRAQKEEEAKKAPNASRAAKERHRGKASVQ